jgi:hypothetical protein
MFFAVILIAAHVFSKGIEDSRLSSEVRESGENTRRSEMVVFRGT